MYDKPLESDWKTFRRLVPEWRERYLTKRNEEIIGILSDANRSPTEQFWDAKEKMEKEARTLTDCLDGHSRSDMSFYLLVMRRRALIGDSDLDQFSGELREHIVSAKA
jgi:hypothetical protein